MAVTAEWSRERETLRSSSVISGLSLVDDDTDDFGRLVYQRAKDEQRLSRALHGSGRAFRKARPHPRIGAALELAGAVGDAEVESPSSVGSDPGGADHTHTGGSDPPLNIPREWGRKARHTNGWLKRLTDAEEPIQRPASAEPQRLELNGALSPRQRTPPSVKDPRHISSPGSLGSNDSLERIRRWEAEQDFTAGSFIQSTPLVTSRKRELDSLKGRGIAKDQLSRISERTSPDAVRDQLESRMLRLSRQPVRNRREASSGAGFSKDAEEVDDPTHGNDKHAEAASPSNGTPKADLPGPRPSTTRTQSIQLLKRLARASSQSSTSSPNDAHVRTSADPGQESGAAGQTSSRAPATSGEPLVNHATPRPAAQLPAKTPKVTGGWVDTPITARHDSAAPLSPAKAPAVPPPAEPRSARPSSPPRRSISAPSALTTLLSRPTPAYGDDTLASLASLLDDRTVTGPAADVSATLDLDGVKAELDRLHSLGRPLTKADEERREELLIIEGMAGKLKNARRGVKEVKRGLRGMEKRVDRAVSNGESVDGQSALRDSHSGLWYGLLREAKGAFMDERSQRLGGLTKAGLAVAALLIWWTLESAACSVWCHPTHARRMSGFGVDSSAPTFPFVIPSMLLRPFRWLWHPVTSTLLWTLTQIWTGLTAYLGILFEDEPAPRKAKVHPRMPSASSRRSYQSWDVPSSQSRTAERIKVKDWDDRVADLIQETAPSHETMDEDNVVKQQRKDKDRGMFGFARLWSWKGSPAESAASVASMQEEAWEPPTDRPRSGLEDGHGSSEVVWETGDGMGGDEVI